MMSYDENEHDKDNDTDNDGDSKHNIDYHNRSKKKTCLLNVKLVEQKKVMIGR